MNKFYLFFLLLLFPSSVFAITINYTCDEFPAGSNYTCTADVVTLNTGVSFAYCEDLCGLQWDPGDVYVSFDYVSSDTTDVYFAGDAFDSAHEVVSGSMEDLGITIPGGNTYNSLVFYHDSAFTAEISNVCVTDIIGDCVATSSPGVSTSSPATTTTVYIQNAAEQMFYGIMIFMVSMWFMIYLLKTK